MAAKAEKKRHDGIGEGRQKKAGPARLIPEEIEKN